ncbi:MAG: acyl-CoA thioesterase-1 [Gammaproteobacteria bacterium]|jgi:acyl-CoA thioesterase-1
MKRIPTLVLLSLATVTIATVTSCGPGQNESDGEAPSGALFDAPSTETTAPGLAPIIPEDAPTLVFLGDSLGAGLHLGEHQALPALLQAQLAEDGYPFHLTNSSESGRTTAGGVTALKWALRSEPDIVVIELGGNDGLRGISVEEIEKNLRSLVVTARESGATVLLLGVRMPPNYGQYAASFDALYPRLAAELEIAFVPYFMEGVGGVAEMNLPDGMHPTAKGHERLAENVRPGLTQILKP